MTLTAPTRPTAVEPGGIEAIPTERRHGSPWQLLSTWAAPNLEFATVFVGVIAVAFFDLDFKSALFALIVGNVLGSVTQGVLSTWGPREGLAQLVLSRTAFGLRGNILPAGLNTAMAGLGWFATNSVSGALAISALTGMPAWLALIIVVVIQVVLAFVGHDLVQLFERYASILLGIVFLIAVITLFLNVNVSAPLAFHSFSFGGFTLTAAAAFGYAAGWNPYASDYTRYLPKNVNKVKVAVAAGLGNFLSCTVLMAAGAAAAYLPHYNTDNPTASFVSPMPTGIQDITLVAIAIGAISANALNIYSGAMSFLAAGVKIPFALRRAIIALGFGIIGFFIALAAVLNGTFSADYENFLLVIAYWIAPWVAIILVDRYLRRGTSIAEFIPESAKYRNPAGIISMLVAGVVSIWLFCNQTFFIGIIAAATTPPQKFAISTIGDLTPLVGFVLAGVLYFILFKILKPKVGGPVDTEPDLIIGVDAADSVA